MFYFGKKVESTFIKAWDSETDRESQELKVLVLVDSVKV